MKVWIIDEDQLARLKGIEARLHAGSDAMRDEGHKLWLALSEIRLQETDIPVGEPLVKQPEIVRCPEKLKPGGCTLHNLHCGWPSCNR